MTDLIFPAKADFDNLAAPDQFRHNWLYSVLPVYDQLYLSGYCRLCDNAFAKIIPHSVSFIDEGISSNVPNYDLLLTKMDIPKWGCVSPKESLGV